MLAGLQDEFEGMTAVGGEHKDKGEACIHSIEGAANMFLMCYMLCHCTH
jgi:hypothetical protein